MGKTYRIAIVGVGAIADVHAHAIAGLVNATLIAGSCRREAKGRSFAETHHCKWYPDYEQMLDTERPDMATICTPSGAHAEPLSACAKRGIHVLCEKPLEINTDRVDQMIAAAAETGIVLGGIFPQRFNPVVQTVQEAAAAGRFGPIATINCYVPWWREDSYYAPDRWQGTLALDGGGALMNQSIHGVDVVQWLAGSTMMKDLDEMANPVEQVFAFTAKRGHDPQQIEVEDTAVAVLRYRNGALGQILGSTAMFPGSLKRIQIGARDGTAEVLEDELITWQFRREETADAQIRQRFSGETLSGSGGAGDPLAIHSGHHMRNIAAFLDALEGKSELMIDGREARKAVRIVEAIYESVNCGKPVSV